MKPNFVKTDNPIWNQNLVKLNTLFTNLTPDNFNEREIKSTTDVTPNTQFLVKHGMSTQPKAWRIYTGDIWIASIDNTFIDIRSTQASMPFVMYITIG